MRESHRFEIKRIPGEIKERDRVTGYGQPVVDSYHRVFLLGLRQLVFDREGKTLREQPGSLERPQLVLAGDRDRCLTYHTLVEALSPHIPDAVRDRDACEHEYPRRVLPAWREPYGTAFLAARVLGERGIEALERVTATCCDSQ
jgi:hypothetical protein